jgi:hypothetical protein
VWLRVIHWSTKFKATIVMQHFETFQSVPPTREITVRARFSRGIASRASVDWMAWSEPPIITIVTMQSEGQKLLPQTFALTIG